MRTLSRGPGQEGTPVSQQPAGGATAPPEVIYIIRHGEKPADLPPAGPGQTPPAPGIKKLFQALRMAPEEHPIVERVQPLHEYALGQRPAIRLLSAG